MKLTLKNLNRESTLLDRLRAEGIPVPAPCSGSGKCGKCLVNVNGEDVLACRTRLEGDAEITIPDRDARIKGVFDLAVDLGTTNVVFALYDTETGERHAVISRPNAQCAYGADVISRIHACREGHLGELSRIARSQVDSVCDYRRLSVSGNTVMEHIYAGIDPSPIGVPPFEPPERFRDDPVLLPCVSGYVGADTVSGLTVCGAGDYDGLVLYIDFGTNGETALGNRSGFLTCSCAAGPAFESAGNLYGSEIVDETARLLKAGLLGRSGRIKGDSLLSQESVHCVQLAKAAIRAGTEILLNRAGKTYSDISALIIAGEFGNYINVENAMAIGLIPPLEQSLVVKAGNTSLEGAALALSSEGRNRIRALCGRCSYIELSSEPDFTNEFRKYINFDL